MNIASDIKTEKARAGSRAAGCSAKLATKIAWALTKIQEAYDSSGGSDPSIDTANAALDAVKSILKASPEIRKAFTRLYRSPNG